MLSTLLSENFRLNASLLFEGLTESERSNLRRSAVTHTYKKKDIIFRDGGIPTGIYYVNAGIVKKYKETPKGKEQIFHLCSEGELLGYHALLGEDRYPESAAAIEKSEITFIPKENFRHVLKGSPKLANRLLKALGQEFTLFINNMTNFATKTVRERVAYNLLILEEKFKRPTDEHDAREIVMSRTDLANMVGTAKETLVRLLQEYKRAGWIDSTGKAIRIINRKEILREANLMGSGQKKKAPF